MDNCWISCQVMADMKKVYDDLIIINLYLKQSQNKKGRKFVSSAPKMVSFFTAGTWEKNTIFGAARKFFIPSYFVIALIDSESF